MLLYLQNPEKFNLQALNSSLNQEQSSALEHLENFSQIHKESNDLMICYSNSKKSSFKAGALNALVPGLGYLYLGQNQSAFTAFCFKLSFYSLCLALL